MDEPAVQPKRLGRYDIVKHLASGGMAEVLLANATGIEGFERHVVVKRIHPEQARNQAFVQMFVDEARLAASLHHQHIVQVHDIGQENGEYFFAMEYVHGEDLRTLLMRVSENKALIPLEHIVTIMLAATSALHYAHEHLGPDRKPLGLVHRDVSPSNILVGYDGSIKVVDFGIAKAALRTDQTKSGVLKGKVAYMSPEQCRGKSLDRRSDIHALGIVLYELLTARRLFKGESEFMTMSAIVASRIPKPSLRRPDLPPELEEIVLKALAKLPEDRYQTAHEMHLALETFATNEGLRTSSTALGIYVTGVLGHKPEPWLVKGDDEAIELTIDFDGSASGLADVPENPFEDSAEPSGSRDSSPIMKARTKHVTGSPLTITSALAELDRHKSGTPMAWESGPVVLPLKKSRRGWLIAAVAIPLVAAGVFAISRYGGAGDEAGASTGAATAPATPPAPSAEPPATASGSADRAAAATTADRSGAPEPQAAGSAAATVKPVPPPAPPRVVVKRPPPKRPPPKTPKAGSGQTPDVPWNPDSLLPESK